MIYNQYSLYYVGWKTMLYTDNEKKSKACATGLQTKLFDCKMNFTDKSNKTHSLMQTSEIWNDGDRNHSFVKLLATNNWVIQAIYIVICNDIKRQLTTLTSPTWIPIVIDNRSLGRVGETTWYTHLKEKYTSIAKGFTTGLQTKMFDCNFLRKISTRATV